MSTKEGIKYSEQNILNESFDKDFGVIAVEPVEFDGKDLRKRVSGDLTVRVFTDSGITYVAESYPGAEDEDPVWRVQQIGTDGSVYWADGNSNFDNIANDWLSLTYF